MVADAGEDEEDSSRSNRRSLHAYAPRRIATCPEGVRARKKDMGRREEEGKEAEGEGMLFP